VRVAEHVVEQAAAEAALPPAFANHLLNRVLGTLASLTRRGFSLESDRRDPDSG
jgi:hypothetical protein